MINRKKLFDGFRNSSLFKGKLTQIQVDTINLFFDLFEERKTLINQQAYILATVHPETWYTWKPIEEKGRGVGKRYGMRIKYSGVRYNDTTAIFYGRGYTQATWYEVYQKLTVLAIAQGKDWNFLQKPDLLLIPKISAWATLEGMELGLYTGYKLSRSVNRFRSDFYNARRVINGLDRAEEIAEYAKEILTIINQANEDDSINLAPANTPS